MLPKDFGTPWKTVYNWHETFARRGTWERVQRALAVRVGDGRAADPSLLSIDSQTVKSAETVPDAGFDGGKRVKGRKRHMLVDSLGLVFAVAVRSAAASDAAGAGQVLRAVEGNKRLAVVRGDSAYHRDTLYTSLTGTRARSRWSSCPSWRGRRCSSRNRNGGWWSGTSRGCGGVGCWRGSVKGGRGSRGVMCACGA